MVKFYSLNARGLRNHRKRREIFAFLKRKDYDVIFIQESHSTPEIEKVWKREWGGEIKYSHFTSAARGTITLFKKNTKIIYSNSDSAGRLNMTQIQLNDTKYMCINIYAPNEERDRALFFSDLSGIIYNKAVRENIVLGGDFNVTLETVDKKSNVINVQKSALNVKHLMKKHGLVDIWRERNPKTKQFTWSNEHKNVMCRLDYFLISKSLATNCKQCKITESILTDHKLIMLDMYDTQKQPRGPGFYKFNDSLLEDVEYINLITHTVIETMNELQSIEDKEFFGTC